MCVYITHVDMIKPDVHVNLYTFYTKIKRSFSDNFIKASKKIFSNFSNAAVCMT